VETGPIDVYVAAFLARCEHLRRPGQSRIEEPGVHGLLSAPDDPFIRLLVTDDRAHDTLALLLPDASAGMINVFAAAERCAKLISGRRAWRPDPTIAMSCGDLRAVPALPLPSDLTFMAVRRLPADPPDGVRLDDAVAAAMKAAPAISDPPHVFAEYLRSLPASFRLFAALDRDGAVRATSASGTFGRDATVIFVNTDPEWRGRGIGQAMTAAALRAARDSGARRAGLDASDAGARIYRRLGFEAVTPTTRFFHTR
jgi:GNAT superfamily N-acetyltransferase